MHHQTKLPKDHYPQIKMCEPAERRSLDIGEANLIGVAEAHHHNAVVVPALADFGGVQKTYRSGRVTLQS